MFLHLSFYQTPPRADTPSAQCMLGDTGGTQPTGMHTCSGGYKGGCEGRAPPPGSKFFQLAPPPRGNPGSATDLFEQRLKKKTTFIVPVEQGFTVSYVTPIVYLHSFMEGNQSGWFSM